MNDVNEEMTDQWGREMIVGFGNCGFVILPLLDGGTPESLVTDLHKMHVFYGDPKEIEGHFQWLREYHVGKPAGLLAVISDREDEHQARYANAAKAARQAERARKEAVQDQASENCEREVDRLNAEWRAAGCPDNDAII